MIPNGNIYKAVMSDTAGILSDSCTTWCTDLIQAQRDGIALKRFFPAGRRVLKIKICKPDGTILTQVMPCSQA